MKSIFITGTDTEVGKTFCASLMVKALLKDNLAIFPFKPISAGTQYYPELEASNNTMANEDAVCLYNAVQRRYSLDQINPIVFDQPIAPHIAAKMAQQALDFNRLDMAYKGIKDLGEVQLIEGAGGWHLPRLVGARAGASAAGCGGGGVDLGGRCLLREHVQA